MKQNRRTFLTAMAALTAAGSAARQKIQNEHSGKEMHIASNQYPWFTFYKRDGRDWSANLDESLKTFSQSGIAGYEPIVNNAEEIHRIAPLLKKYNLEMRSLYVNSILHKSEEAIKSIEEVMSIAKAAKLLNTKIIVTNPTPIKWGGQEDKTDAELRDQVTNLNMLGGKLLELGMTLAYHNHDVEMRQSAREFHHMMTGSDPARVSLCLDAHWIYRGAGNSQVALFDVVTLYSKRIVELHLRQSENNVWTEVFEEGDIDYLRLAQVLSSLRIKPHLVLEQSVEDQTPHTLDVVAAHRADLEYVRRIFIDL